MTLADRVVAHLRATRGEWIDGGLRDAVEIRNHDAQCPLESFRGLPPFSAQRLRGQEAQAIIRAADCARGHNRNLRRRMLRAAGLAR